MQEQYADDGLVVVGVTPANAAAAKPFLERSDATYPVLVDAQSDMTAFGVKLVPFTLLLDADGHVLVENDLDEAASVIERATR
jgi:peroxiredoxin